MWLIWRAFSGSEKQAEACYFCKGLGKRALRFWLWIAGGTMSILPHFWPEVSLQRDAQSEVMGSGKTQQFHWWSNCIQDVCLHGPVTAPHQLQVTPLARAGVTNFNHPSCWSPLQLSSVMCGIQSFARERQMIHYWATPQPQLLGSMMFSRDSPSFKFCLRRCLLQEASPGFSTSSVPTNAKTIPVHLVDVTFT